MSAHQAEQADQDQVDRDHVVQYARHDQDQDTAIRAMSGAAAGWIEKTMTLLLGGAQ